MPSDFLGPPASPAPSARRQAAARHLWPHFGVVGQAGTVFVRGEGCRVWDEDGKPYLDALSTLFCVNAGHGRAEIADAGARQGRQLAFATTWGPSHPPAIELAQRLASLAPGDLERVFFTSGGSESVESALKLARAYHRLRGEPTRTKVVARDLAYHGTTMGALSLTGLTSVRHGFEPLMPGGVHVANTHDARRLPGRAVLWAADAIEERIRFEDPSTIAAVILEPVQNSGGCLPPPDGYFQRVRDICDRHGALLISDEVICGFGRLGEWFGAQRLRFQPDLITAGKGISSAYAPMGAVIASDRVARPFVERETSFDHGLTFGGHPVAAAIALANLDVLEREDLLGNVRRNEDGLASALRGLLDLPIVGDVRGAGYFWGIELMADRAAGSALDEARAEAVMTFVAAETERRGLICRALTRGHPVIQLAPPLIAGPEEFAEIASTLRAVLVEAHERFA
ncbi:MAG: aspartate aminotransferase family protein [Solirubrobacterales bacterium]|nr:aspartate aminotransferase family protein [Solirubrobacterales bacterium]